MIGPLRILYSGWLLSTSWLLSDVAFGQRMLPPTIVEPQGNSWSEDKIYKRGNDEYTIECKASGYPEPKYMWTKNGEKVVNQDDVIKFDEVSGNLVLGKSFMSTNDGVYQCLASNSQGTAMTPLLEISLARAVPFTGADFTTASDFEGNYLALTCNNIPPSVPPHQFKWKTAVAGDPDRGTEIVTDDRHVIDPEGTLHFLWLENSDEKSYVCGYYNTIIKVDMWNTQTNAVTVQRTSKETKPPTIKFNEDVVVRAGDDAVLSCIFSYYSKNGNKLRVKWTLGGKVKQDSTEFQYVIKKVQLPTGTESDEGRYMCEASVDDYIARAHVNLKIIGPPQFEEAKSLKAIWVPKGEDAIFNCEAHSHNAHVYAPTWLINGAPIVGCLPSQFECGNKAANGTSICLPMSSTCNDFPDCDDGSDETGCPGKMSCLEGTVECNGRCIPSGQECTEVKCEYPDFLCRNQQSCLQKEDICNGVNDCGENSDESACAGKADFVVTSYTFNSQRTQMTIPKVELDQNLCVQCAVSNQYGTSFGDGCLTVIDKINILIEPNKTYTVEPGMFLNVAIDATTDAIYADQLNYEWYWFREVEDPNSGAKVDVPVKLPPPEYMDVFQVSMKGKNLTIVVPVVDDEDKTSYQRYMDVAGGEQKYSVIVQHPNDKVVRNFTITGVKVEPPVVVPVTAQASSNLWLIAVILGAIVLIALVIFIVCVVCKRDPRGAYYVDKKEHEAGNDPEQELKDSGFHDVGRVEDDDMDDKPEMEKISLSESVKQYESDDDITEEYGGDFDISSKFNEDGSFIGLYGDKKSKSAGSKEATV